MLGTTSLVFDIQPVRSIKACNGALTVALGNGLVGRLAPDHPDRDNIQREGEHSLRERLPVGVLINGDGVILELTHAHETSVRSVRLAEEDTSRLEVWFWDYSPVCYLSRLHPEFDRILATLEQAAATGERVWLANSMHQVETETEFWWKILDVRPLTGLPSEM
jgi:hypothetical protein